MLRDVPAFMSFSINDRLSALDFYKNRLGLRVNEDLKHMLRLDLADNSSALLYVKPDHQPATYTVLNFQVSNIEQMVDELAVRGVVFEHYNNEVMTAGTRGISVQGPVKMAWFKDPAGNIHSLMEGL